MPKYQYVNISQASRVAPQSPYTDITILQVQVIGNQSIAVTEQKFGKQNR